MLHSAMHKRRWYNSSFLTRKLTTSVPSPPNLIRSPCWLPCAIVTSNLFVRRYIFWPLQPLQRFLQSSMLPVPWHALPRYKSFNDTLNRTRSREERSHKKLCLYLSTCLVSPSVFDVSRFRWPKRVSISNTETIDVDVHNMLCSRSSELAVCRTPFSRTIDLLHLNVARTPCHPSRENERVLLQLLSIWLFEWCIRDDDNDLMSIEYVEVFGIARHSAFVE